MSSTTVHSNQNNQKNTTSVAGTVFKATEKTLEIPPKGQVLEVISNYVEEQGNLETTVGNSIVNEKNQMVKQDGTIIMMHPGAFNAIMKHQQEKQEQEKAVQKGKSTTIVMPHPQLLKAVAKHQQEEQDKDSKVQVGKEDR